MVQTYYWPMIGADSSSMANQLLEIAQGVYQGTLPTVLSWIVESLIILYLLMNYQMKLVITLPIC